MKKIILLLLCAINLSAQTIPQKPNKLFNDYTGLVSETEATTLNDKLLDVNKNTSVEFAIVVIKSLDGNEIFDYSQKLFTEWGIGKKGKDNGILLLISLNDRKWRFHTGYGAQTFLTDLKSKELAEDKFVPYLKSKDYYNGFISIIDAVKIEVSKDKTELTSPKPIKHNDDNETDVLIWIFGFFGFIILAGLVIVNYNIKKQKAELKAKKEERHNKIIELLTYYKNLKLNHIFNPYITEINNKYNIEDVIKLTFDKADELEAIYEKAKLDYDKVIHDAKNFTQFELQQTPTLTTHLISLNSLKNIYSKGENINYEHYDESLNSKANSVKYYYDSAKKAIKNENIKLALTYIYNFYSSQKLYNDTINDVDKILTMYNKALNNNSMLTTTLQTEASKMEKYLTDSDVESSTKNKIRTAKSNVSSFINSFKPNKNVLSTFESYETLLDDVKRLIRKAKNDIDDAESSRRRIAYAASSSSSSSWSTSSWDTSSSSSSSGFDFGGGSSGGSGSSGDW